MKTQFNRFFILIWFLLLYSPFLVWGAGPQLESDTQVSTAGYYRLQWNDEQATDFVLEESQHPSFDQPKILYNGPDTARVVSGRADGDYFYRVKAVNDTAGQGEWSDVIRVQVSHHPLSRALMFFAIGAVVFLATLITIIHGNRTTSTEE